MPLFVCPNCREPLRSVESGFECSNKHHHDRAKEGYINLLPSHHRKSNHAGDSGEMVAARKRFLSAGHYLPIRELLSDCVLKLNNRNHSVDLACGNGYFTEVLRAGGNDVHGVDISKPAIRAASKSVKDVSFAVSNLNYLPFANASMDLATLIFAPRLDDMRRVLKPQGNLIRITPGSHHLFELKQQFYETVKEHQRAPLSLENFKHHDGQELRFEMVLSSGDVQHLVAMTPMIHRLTLKMRGLSLNSENLVVTGHVWVDIFSCI